MTTETTEENTTHEQHLGVIRISMRCLKDILQLPAGYEVVTMHIDSLYNELRLFVSNPELPSTGEYQQLPDVEPVYMAFQINDTQQAAMLTDIRITAHPPRSREELLAQM